MNQYFNKNLIMSAEGEHLFQKCNSCWICKKLIFFICHNVCNHIIKNNQNFSFPF